MAVPKFCTSSSRWVQCSEKKILWVSKVGIIFVFIYFLITGSEIFLQVRTQRNDIPQMFRGIFNTKPTDIFYIPISTDGNQMTAFEINIIVFSSWL